MKKTQILAITGITTGVAGSIAGAVMTGKMYKKNKEAIENNEIKDDKEIKKAKWKTGMTAVGTTLLAGLALASGVGLAMDYLDNENNDNDEFSKNYNKNYKEYEENQEWVKAVSELEESYGNDNIEQDNETNTMDNEINEFIGSINNDKVISKEEINRIGDILDSTDKNMDKIDFLIDDASRNINVVQGIVEGL